MPLVSCCMWARPEARRWLAIFSLVSACGGRGTTGDEGGGGSSQSPADKRPDPAELPYPADQCEPFKLEYDRSLSGGACPAFGCDCSVFSGLPFETKRGCLTGYDCDAVCSASQPDVWLGCALNGCQADADCSSGRCFIAPARTEGLCGQPGGDCIATSDCDPGSVCVVIAKNGTRFCVTPDDRSPCNADEHCPNGHCVFRGDDPIGACSDGALHSACATKTDCSKSLFCGGSSCSDGRYASSCATDAQCQTGACRDGVCVDGRDQDYCDADSDCQSGVCVYGIRCASGEVDAPCEQDDDCKSGRCAGNNSDSACTAGTSGSQCLDDTDCVSGSCRYDVDLRPGSHFGACD